jgi:hypothetical protein
VKLVVISGINWLSGNMVGIGLKADTRYIAGHQQQSQHRLPDDIGNRQKSQNRVVSSSASIGHRVSQA